MYISVSGNLDKALKWLLSLTTVSKLWNDVIHSIIVSRFDDSDYYTLNDSMIHHFSHKIKTLYLQADVDTCITNKGIASLKALTDLDLSLYDASVSQIELPLATQLIRLRLDGNKHIKSLEHLTNLKELSLCCNDVITNDHLIDKPSLSSLKLYCNDNIDHSSVKRLTSLTSLLMGQDKRMTSMMKRRDCLNPISNVTLTRLHGLRKLEILCDQGTYRQTTIDNEGITVIASQLEVLALRNYKLITDESMKRLTRLTKLKIQCGCVITDDGIKELTNLTHLNLDKNSMITGEALINMNRLNTLSLVKNNTITSLSKLTSLTNLYKY
jgi:hypothetical protein